MEDAQAGTASLLESLHNSVTDGGVPSDNTVASTGVYEIARHRCRCWFCPDCCHRMGLDLRERLKPILSTFEGLMMWTFTVDPTLFERPVDAFYYLRERRCIARTVQDLRRGGWLHSARYFYVVEWQEYTEMPHFHVLLDASYIPWETVLESWDKHRPSWVGPVVGERPAFGTVLFSKGRGSRGGAFASAAHAASYVTKYLTKAPENGFPEWVLNLGGTTRVRRYSASRGFWGAETEPPALDSDREITPVTYRERIGRCGATVDVFEERESLDYATGELKRVRAWVGEVTVNAATVLPAIDDGGPPERQRRTLTVTSLDDVLAAISAAAGRSVRWHRGGNPKRECQETPERWTCEEESLFRHEQYARGFDAMVERLVKGEFDAMSELSES